jgi:hypothetical protein
VIAQVIAQVVSTVDPDEARRTARDILSDRQYRSSPTPRPFRRQLTWIGDRVHDLFAPIGRAIADVPLWLVLSIAATVLALAVVVVVRLVRARRGRPDPRRGATLPAVELEHPDELERAAEAAERAGRLDEAVRLRFRAGLLRLGDRGAIRYRPSVTTNEVRRVIGSETFEELARTFEAVAYGGQPATGPDVDTARREWPRVVASAGRRGTSR